MSPQLSFKKNAPFSPVEAFFGLLRGLQIGKKILSKLISQILLNVFLFWIITVVIFKLLSSPCLA